MLGSLGVGGDEGEVDLGLHGRGQLNLGLLGGLADTLEGHAVLAQVDSGALLELVKDVVDNDDVEVLTSEMGVTVGGLHLEHATGDLEDGDIEGSSSEVVHGDHGVLGLVDTVGEGAGGGLVDHAENVEASDLTGILGGLALGVVEVRGAGHDGVGDLAAKMALGGLLHLLEHEGSNLGGGVLLAVGVLDPGVAVGVADDLV